MSVVLDIKSIPQGSTITFRSKNANDIVVWRGTLEAIATYRLIRGYSDPRSYNEAVRQTDNQVPSDVEALTYFMITLDNGSSAPTLKVFASEWIQPGSLLQVSLAQQVTVRIDDPLNDPHRILSILANAGYSVTILS